MKTEAIDYARRGWPVVPIPPGMKHPTFSWANKNAPAEAIAESNWTNQNIFLRTGVAFDVLDIDQPNGNTSLRTYLGCNYTHEGPEVLTPRGGRHLFFLPTSYHNKTRMLGTKSNLDYRGLGGGVVAPPSKTENGEYRWATPDSPNRSIPEAPDWLIALLESQPEPKPLKMRLQTNPYEKHRPDILDILAELGINPGRRSKIRCLFHENLHEPSMEINREDNTFRCWACNAWGDTIDLKNKRSADNRPMI